MAAESWLIHVKCKPKKRDCCLKGLLFYHGRLLRNRVSAQQARERKKVYVNDLELRARELHDKNSKLEEKISTLINENTMLRKVG